MRQWLLSVLISLGLLTGAGEETKEFVWYDAIDLSVTNVVVLGETWCEACVKIKEEAFQYTPKGSTHFVYLKSTSPTAYLLHENVQPFYYIPALYIYEDREWRATTWEEVKANYLIHKGG